MTMPEPGITPESAPAEPGTTEPNPTPAAAAPETAPKPGKRSLADLLADVDEEKRSVIEGEVQKARNEAKNLRERLKDADPAKIKAEFVDEIAKALGLGKEEAIDPAKLTQDLAAQTAAARGAGLELAIYKAAGSLEGDAAKLLDSRKFMDSLADVSPTDADALAEKIRAALEANPDLKTTPARRLPAPNPAQGSSGSGTPDVEAQIVAAQKAGDWKTVIALQNSKLSAAKRN
jgi:hypothetical protein